MVKGEIFGGIEVGGDNNDTEVLMQSLGKCCSCLSQEHTTTCTFKGQGKGSVPDVLSVIKGPWAIIYWQESSKTLWFGRDAFGRRSLLVHWPTMEDSRFLLSSVTPTSSSLQYSGFEVENGTNGNKFWEELSCGIYSMSVDARKLDGRFLGEIKKHEWTNPFYLWHCFEVENGTNGNEFWEELSCGIYSMSVDARKLDGRFLGEIKKHEWTNVMLKQLIEWERVWPNHASGSVAAQNVLTALRESMMRRISLHKIYQAVACGARQNENVPLAVLFSGGLDSMILAALLDECLDPNCKCCYLSIHLSIFLVIHFYAKAGIKELRRVAPLRRWRLVHIDADLSKLRWETKHVLSLINPANTYMVPIVPFLDEDVIRTLLDIPLWEVAHLDQPSGKGDKKILREVAEILGLHNAAILPKRAIQVHFLSF
ncbi:asparagine synthetase domain-containing protein 1 [Herrania umbratica]|uniref:Asparagine synthetase domain-containing protein 1 n=1 Tax=Herrania umbratica TaxID=108875 RepID=A0A6J1BKT1_9ROSI|nr:asparagine synthetase domain-containing protein 1 [Herrania umbratica]